MSPTRTKTKLDEVSSLPDKSTLCLIDGAFGSRFTSCIFTEIIIIEEKKNTKKIQSTKQSPVLFQSWKITSVEVT